MTFDFMCNIPVQLAQGGKKDSKLLAPVTSSPLGRYKKKLRDG